MTLTIDEQQDTAQSQRAGCPVDHRAYSQQKTLRAPIRAGPAIERDAQGIWHVRGPAEARAILRNSATKQAGFGAETMNLGTTIERPILYQEGPQHHEQRRQTARFFTPKFTSENYRELMETLSDKVIAELRREGTADLSKLSLNMAVNVAARVIGLTNSLLPGMHRRLDAFFTESELPKGRSLSATWRSLRNHGRLLAFFLIDVKPAIKARRKQFGEDVISHLITRGYNDLSILTECITYGAAGMVTTREFISIAAWHFLEQPELRQRYLAADEETRQEMLQEILRVEPVVGVLHRRTTEELTIESEGRQVTIPADEHIAIEVYDVNADEPLVGAEPRRVCPGRQLSDERVSPAVMSFGDGHHRCPGAYVAMQESDIFLKKLLAIDSLRIVQTPTMAHIAVAEGYELRKFIVAV